MSRSRSCCWSNYHRSRTDYRCSADWSAAVYYFGRTLRELSIALTWNRTERKQKRKLIVNHPIEFERNFVLLKSEWKTKNKSRESFWIHFLCWKLCWFKSLKLKMVENVFIAGLRRNFWRARATILLNKLFTFALHIKEKKTSQTLFERITIFTFFIGRNIVYVMQGSSRLFADSHQINKRVFHRKKFFFPWNQFGRFGAFVVMQPIWLWSASSIGTKCWLRNQTVKNYSSHFMIVRSATLLYHDLIHGWKETDRSRISATLRHVLKCFSPFMQIPTTTFWPNLFEIAS